MEAEGSGDAMKLDRGCPQFLFDDALIAYQQRVTRRWLPATVFPRPAIEPDRPWEGRILALYGTVLPDPAGGWRMYYTNFRAGKPTQVFLATSPDGFVWERPSLGLVDWNGSRANNIVLAPEWHMDAPSVAYDPADPAAPYKMLAFLAGPGETWGATWGLYAHLSKDGLRWTQMPGVRLRAGDRTNVMVDRSGGKFVALTRHPEMAAQTGGRAVYRSESVDFREWSEPELVMAPDRYDEPNVQIYGMSAFERHGWHFGLVEYWHDTPDVIETHLAISRDGRQWLRPLPRSPFIGPASDWNRAWSTCASNGPIIINEQMVFYFGGRWVAHGCDSAQQYGAIGFASL